MLVADAETEFFPGARGGIRCGPAAEPREIAGGGATLGGVIEGGGADACEATHDGALGAIDPRGGAAA